MDFWSEGWGRYRSLSEDPSICRHLQNVWICLGVSPKTSLLSEQLQQRSCECRIYKSLQLEKMMTSKHYSRSPNDPWLPVNASPLPPPLPPPPPPPTNNSHNNEGIIRGLTKPGWQSLQRQPLKLYLFFLLSFLLHAPFSRLPLIFMWRSVIRNHKRLQHYWGRTNIWWIYSSTSSLSTKTRK